MTRALVTGITGFSGRHLARHLAELGWDLTGSHSGRRMAAADKASRETGASLIRLDPLQPARLDAALASVRPRYIFHLAGRTGPCGTLAEFEEALRSHALATAALLDAVCRLRLDATVLIPGSSAQFGVAPHPERPVAETDPYRPLSLYGAAKTAEALTADCYRTAHGLAVIRTNTFNLLGPGQREDFVPAAFARQIAAIEKGLAPPVLHVGNLASRRDLTDVRDAARAYVAAATRGEPGAVYNVCSGRAPAVGELVERLRSFSSAEFEVREDPMRMRPNDLPVQIGDAGLLRRVTGWEPAIPIEASLRDVLDDWRART